MSEEEEIEESIEVIPTESRRRVHGRRKSDHLGSLILHRDKIGGSVDRVLEAASDDETDFHYSELGLSEDEYDALQHVKHLKEFVKISSKPEFSPKFKYVEVKMSDYSYFVPPNEKKGEIKTVLNQSGLTSILTLFKRCLGKATGGAKNKADPVAILKKVSLSFKPGKMYLVLGPPASGKTTLLRAISNLLPTKKKKYFDNGKIEYNGLAQENEDNAITISNAVTFIEQHDNHAPRLTVRETFNFAFKCGMGGTHGTYLSSDTPESQELIKELDEKQFMIEYVLNCLDIAHVADTFVGDNSVRGVSGGQRRRVTVGEMMLFYSPVICADEISTGLDSKSTYEIVQSLMFASKISRTSRIISLLQPSPETYSLFDEVILLSEGNVMYAGPIDSAVGYFEDLGYVMPENMDVADFLQTISTADGENLFFPHEGSHIQKHLTAKEFREEFYQSAYGKKILEEIEVAPEVDWRKSVNEFNYKDFKKRFQNNVFLSIWLNLKRHFTIWTRDRRYVIALAIKNVVMGMSVGAVFFQTASVESIFGVLFQVTLFIMLGAMTSVPEQINDRSIFYKHKDANFYQSIAFATGRSISLIPQATMDVLIFGTMIYWMVGLSATPQNYFIFIACLLCFTLLMSQMLGVFASIAKTKAVVQAGSAFTMLLLILFCGFIVTPDVIPHYYTWLYWWNPLAWTYRALLLNELKSPDWQYKLTLNNETFPIGDLVLYSKGFIYGKDIFGKEWIAFNFAYQLPYIMLCVLLTASLLNSYRVVKRRSTPATIAPKEKDVATNGTSSSSEPSISKIPGDTFVPVDLTFENICYEVKASKGSEKLQLLNNVSGVFNAGRMCALMGSSGAGKTTLLDVIALRKHTGTITGEVRLNGHLQEAKSFRRCSGYVEQFDVQAPELTVKETVMFSAQLRLDRNHPGAGDMDEFVEKIIHILELTSEANSVVGTFEEGGLTFEQRKRLSIAVELAASPSIIFLDEPTSGLDSRAAMVVISSLKKISDMGRTVCATIHQPSSAIFEMFDDLLLLKKGGETVFFGELGDNSENLIHYFEKLGCTPIEHGENPSSWMLNVISNQNSADFAQYYKSSPSYADALGRIFDIKTNPDIKKKITYEHVFAATYNQMSFLVNKRLRTIYWRSPVYNLGRLTLSLMIAFILSSVFITNRHSTMYLETQMSSILSTIFLSFIIFGVLSITTVLPLMLSIRDVYYRQQASGMIDYKSTAYALGVAEKPFILLASTLFCVIFYFCMGFKNEIRKFVAFWAFFTFYVAISSYFGQAFVCLVKGMATAQILASVFIGLNNFFSGLIVRPQYMTGFWQITYWITPGHYVYEGLVTSQFQNDQTPVLALTGSSFFQYLNCTEEVDACYGTVDQYVDNFFGGRFDEKNLLINAIILACILTTSRALTFLGLRFCNYSSS